MTYEELSSAILEAASMYDGHVTNGSHAEVMKVVKAALQDRLLLDKELSTKEENN